MGKGFRDKTCVYCGLGHAASTADHVVAREFFLEPYRVALPKVPACANCNNAKSQLEHYVLTVLPFGGSNTGASGYLDGRVKRRLQKNRRLHRTLAVGMRTKWVKTGAGPWQEAGTLPFESAKLMQLGAYIVRGLAWHHWKTIFLPSITVKADLFNERGRQFFERVWSHPDWAHRVEKHLGGDVVSYRGASALGRPNVSVWEISFFGGVELGGDPQQPGEVSRALYCATFDPAGSDSLTSALT
jgi:hypothetical protein